MKNTTTNTTYVIQIKWAEEEYKDYMSFAFFEDADDTAYSISAPTKIIKRTVTKTVETIEEEV